MMMARITILAAPLLALVIAQSCFAQDLNFPEIVQNVKDDAEDNWLFHQQLNGESFHILFHDDNMTVVSKQYAFMDKIVLESRCILIESTGDVNEENDIYYAEPYPHHFLNISFCLTFHKRTNNVIQMTVGQYHSDDNGTLVCEGMRLNDSPLIASKPKFEDVSYHPCSLQLGAYNMKTLASVTEGVDKVDICLEHPFKGLLESECYIGEHLQLTFPAKNCIPRYTGWEENHQLLCLETWNQGNYSFTLMGDEYFNPQFIMRVPIDMENTAIIHIYQDLVAPSGDPNNNTNYIAMEVHKKSNEPCKDDPMLTDDQACNTTKCSYVLYKSTCQETCKFCDDHPVGECSIAEDFRGMWQYDSDDGQYGVNIEEKKVKMTVNASESDFMTMACHTEHDTTMHNAYKMKVDSINGCLPRYTCTKMNKISPAVMQYQISQMQKDSLSPEELCMDSNFRDDPYPFYDKIRSRDYNILTIKDITPEKTVSCGFQGAYNMTVRVVWNDLTCEGGLTDYHNCTSQNFVTLNTTCDKGHNDTFVNTFDCLGILDFGTAFTKALITNHQEKDTKMCWLLLEGMNPLQFYAMKSAQCDRSTLDDIANGERNYAAFIIADRVDTCNGVPTTDHTPVSPVTFTTTTSAGASTSTGSSSSTMTTSHKPSQGTTDSVSAGKVIGIMIGILLGAVLIVAGGWFIYRLYLAKKQPYRVL